MTSINVVEQFRYEAIVCPFRTCQSTARIRRVILLCWISSFLVALPQLFIFELSRLPGSTTKYRCASTGYTAEWQRRLYFTIFACYVLFIPVFCMTIWYIRIIRVVGTSIQVWTRNRRGQTTTTTSTTVFSTPVKMKTTKLALTIILVFIVCWTPYMVITLLEVYTNGRFRPPSWFDGVLQAICLLQSGLNPLIYLAFNRERKYPAILILAAASTMSQKSDRRQRERLGSVSFCSTGENSHRAKPISLLQRS
jgi:gonadotropin-releasing hormone receptor